VREGACIGAATILQPWTLRLMIHTHIVCSVSREVTGAQGCPERGYVLGWSLCARGSQTKLSHFGDVAFSSRQRESSFQARRRAPPLHSAR
jgi:hypothetical protein